MEIVFGYLDIYLFLLRRRIRKFIINRILMIYEAGLYLTRTGRSWPCGCRWKPRSGSFVVLAAREHLNPASLTPDQYLSAIPQLSSAAKYTVKPYKRVPMATRMGRFSNIYHRISERCCRPTLVPRKAQL